MNTNKELIEIVDALISNFDPTPINVNDDFPLRWESNIFIEDYDFSENYLDLDQDYESLNGKFLKSRVNRDYSMFCSLYINGDEKKFLI
jgi:hypothetical protein